MATAPAEPKAKATKYVQATKDGTYPHKGETYAVYRRAGATFELNDPKDFAPEWMREVSADEANPLPEPARGIPQTAGRRVPVSPFPPNP